MYFAKFPQLDAVKRTFNSGESSIPGYADFLAEVTALIPEGNQLVAGIENYIFGVDEKRVKKRISEISGFYLFIDYGELSNTPDHYGTTKSQFYIAATVARPINKNQMDDAEEILVSQLAMDYLLQIRTIMKTDDRSKIVRKLRIPDDITPFAAPELNSSIGFTMTFTMDGVLL